MSATQAPVTRPWGLLRELVAELRVHQWVKNLLVFVAPLAAHTLGQTGALLKAAMVFAAFCAAASGVYIVNDILDLRTDRAHPRKRNRPFASGRLPLAFGTIGPVLMAGGVWLAFSLSLMAGIVLTAYVALTLGYSMYLKTQPLVDVFTLSALYTIRVYAGEAVLDIEASQWLLSFSGFMFLSLAVLKRVSEYQAMLRENHNYETRRGYKPSDLLVLKMLGVGASFSATIVFSIYISTESAATEYARPILLWGMIPIFLFWQSRMWLAVGREKMTDDPIVYAARDWVSQLCVVLLGLFYAAATFT